MNGPCSQCSFALEKEDCHEDDLSGVTTLMTAGCNGYEQCVKAWIDAGADVNAVNTEGQTALIQACSWGNSNYIDVLIKARADVNVAHNDGTTALQGSHSDWKTWKNGKAFSSQGKVREF